MGREWGAGRPGKRANAASFTRQGAVAARTGNARRGRFRPGDANAAQARRAAAARASGAPRRSRGPHAPWRRGVVSSPAAAAAL